LDNICQIKTKDATVTFHPLNTPLHLEIIPCQEKKQTAGKRNTRNVQCSSQLFGAYYMNKMDAKALCIPGFHTLSTSVDGPCLILVPRWTLQAIGHVHLLNDTGSFTFW
jgi:hypothetical protein